MTTTVNQLGIPDPQGTIFAPDMPPGLEYPYWNPATGWINNPDAYAPQVPLPPTSGFVEPEPAEPTVVTMSQCRIALLQYGLLDEVDAYFVEQAKTGGEVGRALAIEWEYSTVVVQGAPLVNQVQAAFGWTDEFVNDLFALAKTL